MYLNFLLSTTSVPYPCPAMPNSSARSAIASGSSDGKIRSASPKISKDFGCRSTSWNSRLPSPVRMSSSPVPKPSPSEGKPSSSVSKVPSSERKPSTPVGKQSSPARKSSSPVKKQCPPVTKSHSSILHSPKFLESKPSIESKTTLKSKPEDSEIRSKLDAAVEYLKKLEEKLVSVEEEKIKAFEELKEAKGRINEITEKLQLAIIARKKAEKGLETEKFVVDELVQAGIANAEAYQKELKSIQEQHSLNASTFLAFTKELHKLKLVLSNAINEKNSSMKETDDAEYISELNVDKVNALFTEVGHLKSLLDSDLDMHKVAIETIRKLNDENNALKHELGRAKLLEERLPKMEALAKQLQMEVSDKKVESDGSKQVEELKKEVAPLEASMKEANQSETSAVATIAIIRKRMGEETSSLQDAETEIAALKRKIASLENEFIKYKHDLEETDRDPILTQQEVLCLEKTVELLKSELEKLEEEKFLLNSKIASAEADLHMKEKNGHSHELENSREDGEKARTAANESLASTLHEISRMSTENERRLLAKQAEIEAAQTKTQRSNSDIRNTKDEYELMLDYIKYEILCLKKAIERFEVDSNKSRTECDAKELYFVNDVERSEGELACHKVEMAKDLKKLVEKEAHMLKRDKVDIVSKLGQAFDASEEVKLPILQLEKKSSDKGTVLQCDTQYGELWIKQSSFLCLTNHQKFHQNGQEPKEHKDGEKRINEDGGCSMYPMSNGLVVEKDHEAEVTDDSIALKTDVDNSEWTFGMTQSQLNQKKKTDFLRRFGNFLKKKKGVDIVHK